MNLAELTELKKKKRELECLVEKVDMKIFKDFHALSFKNKVLSSVTNFLDDTNMENFFLVERDEDIKDENCFFHIYLSEIPSREKELIRMADHLVQHVRSDVCWSDAENGVKAVGEYVIDRESHTEVVYEKTGKREYQLVFVWKPIVSIKLVKGGHFLIPPPSSISMPVHAISFNSEDFQEACKEAEWLNARSY